MTLVHKREKALVFRTQGLSLSEIASKLIVSKSTVSLWCQNISLTKMQLQRLKKKMVVSQEQGRLRAIEAIRAKKLKKVEGYRMDGLRDISKLSKKEFLVTGIGLYWGEGSKSGKLSFINSDPELIKFMYIWFQKVFGIKKADFMPRVFINISHKDRIDKVINFWSKQLKLPKSQFGKVTLLKMSQKKVYANRETYYGVLALRIRKGTNGLYRILGLIEGLKRGI
ncbi:MAG: hypothetical protein Q7R65_03365 [bacterium]|nr:hypothetical protein [bacterium]